MALPLYVCHSKNYEERGCSPRPPPPPLTHTHAHVCSTSHAIMPLCFSSPHREVKAHFDIMEDPHAEATAGYEKIGTVSSNLLEYEYMIGEV
jgi:hypothetical protein